MIEAGFSKFQVLRIIINPEWHLLTEKLKIKSLSLLIHTMQ